MSKAFWGIIAAIIVIFVVVFSIDSHSNKSSNKNGSNTVAGVTQHKEGNNSSTGVTLVEYGDYECPFCGQYYPIVKQVQAEYKDKIVFQFRNFPLTSLHPNAMAGARAAEAAALQGKFWEMHDELYDNQDQNGSSGWVASSDPLDKYFVGFAQQIGLNVDQFKTDFASSKVNDLIQADLSQGNSLGITGTPTFFIETKVNGKTNDDKVQIGESVSDFEKVLNDAIKKGSATSSGSTSQTKSRSTSNTTNTSGQ